VGAPVSLRELPGPDAPPLGPWAGSLLDAGTGARVFVRRVPDSTGAEPAVFVHGLGGAATNWTDLAWLLADVVDGYAVDLPGFGYSEPAADGRYRLDAHVDAVQGVIRRLERGAVHLFGNSLGGAVAVRLAADHPDLVRSLTLVSPALPDLTPWRLHDPRLLVLLTPGVRGIAQRRLSSVPAAARARRMLRLCYADPTRVHPDRVDQVIAEIERRDRVSWANRALLGSLDGLARANLEPGSRSLWRQAAALEVPTLLLWGRKDRLVNVAVGHRAHRRIRGSKLVIYPDCGHVAQLEAPERVAAEAWRHVTAAR